MSQPTFLFADERMLGHDPGPGHPESPARLEALLADFARSPLPGVVRRQPRPATRAEIEAVHAPEYFGELQALAGQSVRLDPDTALSSGSWEAG